MPLYCIYPCAADGLASTFETADLSTDAEADAHARLVLDAHCSARSVVVWCGDRKVLVREETRAPRLRARRFGEADAR
jgi:hypothetical protein